MFSIVLKIENEMKKRREKCFDPYIFFYIPRRQKNSHAPKPLSIFYHIHLSRSVSILLIQCDIDLEKKEKCLILSTFLLKNVYFLDIHKYVQWYVRLSIIVV